MQHNNSDPGCSAIDNPQSMHVVGFTITHQYANILKDHLNDFQHAKTAQHADIMERAMAEIFEPQPQNSFDKNEASKVFCVLFVYLYSLGSDMK